MHVLKHLAHIRLFVRETPLEGANRSGLYRIYTVIHSVVPFVLIVVHSKDISVLVEELFQLSAFSFTQIWPNRCNHVL